MAQVGFIGERLDLLCRQGANLGPFICTLQNPDLSFVDLTGCTIQGYVRKNALDAGQPVIKELPFRRKFKSYVGLGKAERKLRRMLTDFCFTDISEAAKQIDWTQAPIITLK